MTITVCHCQVFDFLKVLNSVCFCFRDLLIKASHIIITIFSYWTGIQKTGTPQIGKSIFPHYVTLNLKQKEVKKAITIGKYH